MPFEPLIIHGTKRYEDDYISFEIEPDDLLNNYERYERYVKHIEAIVRGDDRYTSYIAKLKQGGLTRCAVLGNLPTDDPKIKVEMHHGPIFNLFDYCDIVLKASLNRGEDTLTSFDIADRILIEHEMDNIMIVMLSKPVHMEGAHNKKSNKGLFVGIEATFGRLDRFIDRWADGMEREHEQYIDKYINECRHAKGKTLDQGLFDVADKLASFK